jgi:hypothetical protein
MALDSSVEDIRDDLFGAIEGVLIKHHLAFPRDSIFCLTDDVLLALQDAGIVPSSESAN